MSGVGFVAQLGREVETLDRVALCSKAMMKRYSLKVGAGLISLAMGAGIVSPVLAQTRLMTVGEGAQATAGGTATQLAFELAMTQADTHLSTGSELSFEMAMAQAALAGNGMPAPVMATAPGQTTRALAGPDGVGPDGLVPGGAYVQADQIETPDSDTVIARGHVEMRYKDRIIRADSVTYNSRTGKTIAEGHTQTISEDGSVQFSDKVTYDDNMSSGVSENFAAVSKDNSKVFARRVERVNDFTTRLSNIVYTPCQLCQAKGVTREPSWSIEAGTITQRKDKKMVYYNNAVVKIHGVPVLYMPYMWTPDPELERASGFLQPKVQFSRKRGGLSYEQPYLWSLSPYSQLIVSPQFNAGVNPLVNVEFDRHFYSGELHARFGFTNESFFDNAGARIGPAATRDYLLADGAFKINQDWRWSFTAQHIKDKYADPTGREYDNANFFERYSIDDPFQQIGEWTANSRELISQAHITRQTDTSYVSLSVANFQSLAVSGQYVDSITGLAGPTISDHSLAVDSNLYPAIAPMIEAYWSPKSRLLGGQLTLSANALALIHKLYVPNGAPAYVQGLLPAQQGAYDTARASLGASWYGNMTTRSGVRWGPFFDVRHDQYRVTHLDASGKEASISRDLGTVGFNFSYPLYKRYDKFTAIIEPLAQFAVSPAAQVNPYLPTEDSQSFEFDSTNLFTANRSPGFDIYEGGSRLNLGVRSQLKFDSGLEVEGLVGRILRDKPETQFLKTVSGYTYDPSGLGNKNSDWVVDGSFDTGKGLYGYTRLRLDSETTRLSQGEWGLSAFNPKTVATVRYIFNDLLVTPYVASGKLVRFGDNYRNLQLYARHFFTDNWGVSTRLDRDMVNKRWRRSTISLIYRDDCSWYELVYQRNESDLYAHNGKPQSSILFRLNLATLGTSGSEFNDVR